MPIETLRGSSIPRLLTQAQEQLGGDAVVLSCRRRPGMDPSVFELLVADPETARRLRPAPAPPARPDVGPTTRRPAERAAGREGPTVIALVGPTGAGKTTTIAKLANHPDAFAGKRVGLLCLDTYRIGAVEQSRIYAELSRIPLEVAYDATEIPRAMRRLRRCEVVLVDTPGRGPQERSDVEAMDRQLSALRADEVHLALPSGLQPGLTRRIIDRHLPRGVTHILVTKIDEFPEDLTVFDAALAYRIPVRWIAVGQKVPQDLQPASSCPLVEGSRAAAGSRRSRGIEA